MKPVDDYEAARRRDEIFRRIHQLHKRGYRIDWTVTDVEGAFWLDHPGRADRKAPNLILYPDGKMVERGGRPVLNPGEEEDRDRIYNHGLADDLQFDRWLGTVKLPNWRERTAADRQRFIWQPGCLFSFYIVPFVLWLLVEDWVKATWRSVLG